MVHFSPTAKDIYILLVQSYSPDNRHTNRKTLISMFSVVLSSAPDFAPIAADGEITTRRHFPSRSQYHPTFFTKPIGIVQNSWNVSNQVTPCEPPTRLEVLSLKFQQSSMTDLVLINPISYGESRISSTSNPKRCLEDNAVALRSRDVEETPVSVPPSSPCAAVPSQ